MVSLRHFQTTTTTTSCLRTTCKRWTSSDSMKMEPPILARPTGGCGNIARTALRAPLAKRSFVGPVQATSVASLRRAATLAALGAAQGLVRRRGVVAEKAEVAEVTEPACSSAPGDLAAEVRPDFAALRTDAYAGVPLIYLDSGATSQKPACVLQALTEYYEHSANVHRGAYALAERATEAFEHARSSVAELIGAASPQEIIFTSGATDAINLVAESWGSTNLKPDDEVLITVMEHHSNIVPWQLATQRTGAKLKYAGITDEGTLDLEEFKRLLSPKTKIVAFVHISNTLGCINPVKEMAEAAHAVGAKVK
ncbi:Probable cysteine desulfurase [Durusdinium trenchii]|uniref:Probable cysteine desulfurase n=1 Tax=Durusdinium trenchii TaxID=1381693 RepID=A0ABP0KLL6_9DINO